MSTSAEPNTTDTLVGAGEPARPATSALDQVMRRLLRLTDAPAVSAADARSSFQKSLAFTACRCTLMYLIFPFV
ncbi:MAG: hypothetical protein ACJAR2_004105, partial [Ilumatobacter sp.]